MLVSDTEYSLHMTSAKELRDESGVPRRKQPLTVKHTPDDFEENSVQVPQRHDPQELKIYIKQLSKALKFLPLGSRAYYAVTGELLRATTQLKSFSPVRLESER